MTATLTAARYFAPISGRRLPFLLVALGLLLLPPVAGAVSISFNGGALIINDQGIGDTNTTVGVLDFNTTVGGYKVAGTVDQTAGPSVVSLLGSPTAALRLTNFTAEAVGAPPQLGIQFYDTVLGFFPSVTGADSLDAYVGHATGAPVPPGNDVILDWQGFVSGVIVPNVSPGPPPYFNPFLPPSSLPLPYSVVTHGPFPLGAFINPVFGAYLTFQLGSNGDQLILPSSGEVGILAVPEPTSTMLMATGLGLLALVIGRKRSRR
ncbi:MAG: PEP-CTERM sorting domain-containing protein [Pirellulales bacterium]|nr:PEP-CTERM sorting domain-containing protein [Pirellulales bacterium]